MKLLFRKLKWAMGRSATGRSRLLLLGIALSIGLVGLLLTYPQFTLPLLLLGTGCATWATCIEPRWVRRRQFIHPVRGLKTGEVIRLIMLGDLHVGAPHFGERALQKVLRRVEDERADALILVGDYVIQGVLGGRPVPIERTAALLAETQLPTVAVIGNHDVWGNRERIRNALVAEGAIVLENADQLLQVGDLALHIVGLDDESTGTPDPQAAFPDTLPTAPLLVLAHDPATFQRDMPLQGDLLLAGHTHAGQVRIPGIGALIVPGRSPLSWSHGWTQTSNGPLYVTSGLGTSIVPIRFFAPPEYVVIDLVAFERSCLSNSAGPATL
jgi:predicted MPP superfamily phosphohydrolase